MKKIYLLLLPVLILFASETFAQNTLSLEECKQLALLNNSKSKNSKLEVEASKQAKKSAFTNYFPSISAGGIAWSGNKSLMEMDIEGGDLPVYDGNPANLASATQFAYFPDMSMGMLKEGTTGYINAMQPVFAGGRIVNGNKLAALSEEVSKLNYKLTKNEILLSTTEQYWTIVSLKEKLKTILKYEKLLQRLLQQVDDAYNSGIVMKNDVLKVKLQLSEIELNKSKLENGIELATLALSQYLGTAIDSSTIFNEELEVSDLPQSSYVEKNEALKKRTEYSLLEKSVTAEKLLTKIKLGEYLPQAGIGVSGIYMKFDGGDDRTLGMVYGTVSVPISNWWGGSHELKERSIKEEIAENNFQNNSELLILQIEKSWQELTEAYKQYQLAEESEAQAEENHKVNEDSYQNGLITVSDLLEAQALLQQTKDQVTDAKTNYLVKKAAYLQVTGR